MYVRTVITIMLIWFSKVGVFEREREAYKVARFILIELLNILPSSRTAHLQLDQKL